MPRAPRYDTTLMWRGVALLMMLATLRRTWQCCRNAHAAAHWHSCGQGLIGWRKRLAGGSGRSGRSAYACTAQPLAISTLRLSLTSFLHALALLRCVPSSPSFSRRPMPLLHSFLHRTASSWPALPVHAIALTTNHVTVCAPPP